MMDKFEAQLEAAHDFCEQMKNHCIQDPDSLASAIDTAKPAIRSEFFRLLGLLQAHDMQHGSRPDAWIEARDFVDTVSDLCEHVESMVADYLEDTAKDN